MIEDYNRIIDSLHVKYIHLNHLEVLKPVRIDKYYDLHNTLILLKKGTLSVEGGDEFITAGGLAFLPAQRNTTLCLGVDEPEQTNYDTFVSHKERYLTTHQSLLNSNQQSVVSFVSFSFDAKAFDSVSFFNSLDIPPFVLQKADKVALEFQELSSELDLDLPGRSRMIALIAEALVLKLFRYILDNQIFVEKIVTNSSYFKDPRLIKILNYIKDNLSGDLSNKALASIANVSEDYVGQYFKSLTGINPQDYIEYQRMEKAIELLRNSKKSVRNIGHDVGYKDTAYFCRRFKMMFGIPAGKMRRRESAINIS